MKPGGKRIGIDARFYIHGAAGLARYTQELISHLTKAKSPHTFVIFLRRDESAEFKLQSPNLEVRYTDIPHYTVREQLVFGRELRAAKLDLMHFTNFNFPIGYRRPFIISINDLTLLSYAGRSKFSRLKVRPMREVMRAGAKRSLKILTYSEHQKDLIVNEFRVAPEKVEPIYLAVDPQFKPLSATNINAFRKRVGLSEPFIMYTGQWRQHKNLVRLIKAFKLVQRGAEVKLVLAGKIDSAFPIIPETIHAQGVGDSVVFTDFVADEDLPRYYNAAEAFAFPSLSEGFGLPPLEAMACGTPVVSSNAPPMPEILGDAADYFDPRNVEDIAESLLTVLKDKRRQATLRRKGLAQVKRYSWRRTATETLEAYDEALASLAGKAIL